MTIVSMALLAALIVSTIANVALVSRLRAAFPFRAQKAQRFLR